MSGHSRTKTERVIALEEVARLDRRGYNQFQIADLLGVTQQQVSYDLKAIRKQYAEATIATRAEYVAEKIEQLREVEREAWAAWDRSKENHERTTETTEKVEQPVAAPSASTETTLGPEGGGNRLKTIIMKEGRLPESAYLQTIIACHKEEAALRGLYPPIKHKHSGDEDEPPIKFATTVKVIGEYARYFGLMEQGSEATEAGSPHCNGVGEHMDSSSSNGKAG